MDSGSGSGTLVIGTFFQVVAAYLVGCACNHVPLRSPSKFVVIGCAIVSIFIIVVRIALVCYRNKRRKRANMRMVHDLVFQS